MKRHLIIILILIATALCATAKKGAQFSDFASQNGTTYTYVSPSMLATMGEYSIQTRTINISTKELSSIETISGLSTIAEDLIKRVKQIINKEKLETLATRRPRSGATVSIFGKTAKGGKQLEKLIMVEQTHINIKVTYLTGRISFTFNNLDF